MNTADQSVDTLDLAFRRRFTFQPVRPNASLLIPTITISVSKSENSRKQKLSQAAEPKASYSKKKVRLDKLLKAMNDRLLWLKGEDYLIGHAYFLPVLNAEAPLTVLREVIYQRIIPLLEEYFFDDWEKRIAVLHPDFVEELNGEDLFTEESSVFNIPEKRYRWRNLNDVAFLDAIQRIYQHE